MGLKVVRIDENRQAAYQEYVAGYNFAKHARAKNKQVSPEEEAQMSPAFKQGYRKGLTEGAVMEGPMDFMRGMAGAAGQKVAQSAPVQAVKRTAQAVQQGTRDVVQAGRTASANADFAKLVMQLAQSLAAYDKLKGAMPKQADAPQDDASAAPAQQPPQQQSASPEAFRTSQKPKGRMGQHGFEYTFNSFIQDMTGEQINEGMWDFVKGAGSAIAGKAREKINAYADKNRGWLNDVADAGRGIVQAGRDASAAGNARKAAEQLQQVEQQGKQLLAQVVAAMKKMGDNGRQVLGQAVKSLPPDQQQRVIKLVLHHA